MPWMIIIHDMSNQVEMVRLAPAPARLGDRCRKLGAENGRRITVPLLILLPKLGGSDSYPVGLTPTERGSLRWTHSVSFPEPRV